jgi:predicted Fe-Mo cluster-binding NifX family protein
MKIALTSTGKELTSDIDPRFGRCAYFIVVDTDSRNVEIFPNENKDLTSGAGIQAATFIASTGVQAVITGNCGPNAIDVLSAAGIDLYTGEGGRTVKASMERFIAGSLPSSKTMGATSGNTPGPNNEAAETARQYMPQDRSGRGMGMGGGRGMDGCGGRGMGGRGRGMGGCGGRGMGGGGGRKIGGGRGMDGGGMR